MLKCDCDLPPNQVDYKTVYVTFVCAECKCSSRVMSGHLRQLFDIFSELLHVRVLHVNSDTDPAGAAEVMRHACPDC